MIIKKPVIKPRLERIKKLPIKSALKIIADDNKTEAKNKGWNRFNRSINISVETSHSGKVSVNGSMGSGLPRVSDNQIGGFLHYGTKAHGPVKAKVLRFFTGSGSPVFTKWVKGIKAKPWWGLKEKSKKSIRKLLSDFIRG